MSQNRNTPPDPRSVLKPGTIILSENYPNARSIILEDRPTANEPVFKGEEIKRDWEYVTAARPIDLHERIYELPTNRLVQTVVPKIQVREVVKTIPKTELVYVDERHPVQHERNIDKYVEVPVTEGKETKYVPKVEVLERTVEVEKPEIKYIDKHIDVPRIKEVVRYVESDSNVEQVIRYIPKKEGMETEEYMKYFEEGNREKIEAIIKESRQNVQTPRIQRTEQLLIPKITKTVEVNKEVPVNVLVPLPFVVPKVTEVPIEVPVMRFRDHFIPVPVRRHVIPRIIFTDEVYEVQCVKEKPVLVVENEFKPVPVNVKIHLKEKDIRIHPIDQAELSQADHHAMWMRVNADLLAQARERGETINILPPDLAEAEEGNLSNVDIGPIPLHPGHPLMMTYLQNQWAQVPTTHTHNLYTPEFFRMHASALDSVLHPQPHQVNITEKQAELIGPAPEDIIPSPFANTDSVLYKENYYKDSNRHPTQQDFIENPDDLTYTYKFHVPVTEPIQQQ